MKIKRLTDRCRAGRSSADGDRCAILAQRLLRRRRARGRLRGRGRRRCAAWRPCGRTGRSARTRPSSGSVICSRGMWMSPWRTVNRYSPPARELGRAIVALVVDAQLLGRMDVVELDHLLAADDGEAALFARIEPRELHLRHHAAGEAEVDEDDVLDAAAAGRPVRARRRWPGARRRGRGSSIDRAARTTRARSRRGAGGPGSRARRRCRRRRRSRRRAPCSRSRS